MSGKRPAKKYDKSHETLNNFRVQEANRKFEIKTVFKGQRLHKKKLVFIIKHHIIYLIGSLKAVCIAKLNL